VNIDTLKSHDQKCWQEKKTDIIVSGVPTGRGRQYKSKIYVRIIYDGSHHTTHNFEIVSANKVMIDYCLKVIDLKHDNNGYKHCTCTKVEDTILPKLVLAPIKGEHGMCVIMGDQLLHNVSC
jgi:hypothetical protein